MRAAKESRLPSSLVGLILAAVALVSTALVSATPASGAGGTEAFPNGVASGDTGFGSTVLWTRVSSAGDVRFEIASSPLFLSPVREQIVAAGDPRIPVKAEFNGLRPGTRYFYRVTDAGGRGLAGSFRTAPRRGREGLRGLRFGVSGDGRGELAPFPSIANAPARNLDFFVALGDTIYADFPSPAVPLPQAATLEEFRAKHDEVYSAHLGLNAWVDLRGSTSVFAMIDDHEVTNDFAGGAPAASDPRFQEAAGLVNETRLYRNGLQAFMEFNPIRELVYDTPETPLTDAKPYLYRSQAYGDLAALILLDARSFRDQELPPVLDPLDAGLIRAFLALSFDLDPLTGQPLPGRTLLGPPQIDRLKQDLLQAQRTGITWKFVCVPEPIQNLGPVQASDRFEGYAAERSDLLAFIDRNGIENVVFVSADIHGTIVNNLTYQMGPDQPQIRMDAFEITTGPVAFDAPFGPTVLDAAAEFEVSPGVTFLDALLRALGLPSREAFDALPRRLRDAVIEQVINVQLVLLGYDRIGLERSPLRARLLKGLYVSVFTFGWTEFYIAPLTHNLWVTTYGIDPYTEEDVGPSLLERRPEVVSRFVVSPRRSPE
jgi:phosphodiesterase/alkaline phosphatase D-like protein